MDEDCVVGTWWQRTRTEEMENWCFIPYRGLSWCFTFRCLDPGACRLTCSRIMLCKSLRVHCHTQVQSELQTRRFWWISPYDSPLPSGYRKVWREDDDAYPRLPKCRQWRREL